MPLITQDKIVNDLQPRQTEVTPKPAQFDPVSEPKAPAEPPQPPVIDQFKAGFLQYNTIGRLFTFGVSPTSPVAPGRFHEGDPDFDIQSLVGTEYEKDIHRFTGVNTRAQADAMKQRVDKLNANKDIFQRSGWIGTLSAIAGGVLDPTLLIPGGLGIKALTRTGQVLRNVGASAGLGAAAIGTQEAILQSTRLDFDAKQSLIDVTFGAVLGGILGGVIGRTSRTILDDVSDTLKKIDSGQPTSNIRITPEGEVVPRSAGAAEVDPLTRLEDTGIAGVKPGSVKEKIIRGIASPVEQFRSPVIRGLTSSSPQVRELTSYFFEHSLTTGRGARGDSVFPAETLIKAGDTEVTNIGISTTELYMKYLGIKMRPGTISKVTAAAKARTTGRMSFKQFDEEVGRHVESNKAHKIPEINAAVKLHQKYYSQMAERLIKAEVFDDNFQPRLAKQYFPRKWKTDQIIANRKLFVNKLARHFRNRGFDADAAFLQANKTADKIIGLGDEAMGISQLTQQVATKGGKFTQKRVLDVNRADFDQFLENSAQEVMFGYARRANGLIALKQSLKGMGFEDVSDLKRAIEEDYSRLKEANPNQANKLDKKLRRDLQLVNDDVSILLGQINPGRHSPSGQALATLRKYQTMALLGGVTISSFPDVAMLVFKHGLPRAIMDGYGQYIFNHKNFKGVADELQHFGLAADVMSGKMLRALADGDMNIGLEHSVLARFGEEVLQFYGKATGLTYWNQFHKRMAGYVSMSRTIDTIVNNKLSRKEVGRLSKIGIGKSDYEGIREQFKRFGDKHGRGYNPNFEKWENTELAKKLALSSVREADATILTPGLGDLAVPIQKSNWLRSVFQFKSFSQTATNRLLIPAITEFDMNTIMAFSMLIGMGYVSYATKELIKGRTPSTDVDTILSESLSRSGTLGLFGDYIVALSPYGTSSRFAGRNTVGNVLGPSVGTISGVGQTINNLSDFDITEKEAQKMLKLLPFQNIFYLRLLLEKAGD